MISDAINPKKTVKFIDLNREDYGYLHVTVKVGDIIRLGDDMYLQCRPKTGHGSNRVGVITFYCPKAVRIDRIDEALRPVRYPK